MYILRKFLLPILCFLLVFNSRANAQEEIIFSKGWDSEEYRKAMLYRVHSGTCLIEWSMQGSKELGRTSIAESTACKLPIEKQTPLRDRLLEEIQKEIDKQLPLTLFSLGFLSNGIKGGAFDIFSDRLAQVAAASTEWDGKKGHLKNRKKRLALFVIELMNTHHIFKEIEDVFERQGYRIKVSELESIYGDKVNGVIVPVNALVWFSVERSSK